MKAYVGQTRSATLIDALAKACIGECTVRGEYPPRRRPWFLDNGAYVDYAAGKKWEPGRWLDVLKLLKTDPHQPDFVVVPDIVAGGMESLDFSLSWVQRLEGHTIYLAVQDGMPEGEVQKVARIFDGIFVGGSLAWKLETGAAWVDFAHRNGMACHVGRVGTAPRVRWAREIGADSIDSSLPLWSAGNLEHFLDALRADDKQTRLW